MTTLEVILLVLVLEELVLIIVQGIKLRRCETQLLAHLKYARLHSEPHEPSECKPATRTKEQQLRAQGFVPYRKPNQSGDSNSNS